MPITMGRGSPESAIKKKELGMTEQEKRLADERAEIAARVANFRATQQKFEREREEYFNSTLQVARGIKPIPSWS
jgi:predicted  nucleic acid-binding Zn-ribbon protein